MKKGILFLVMIALFVTSIVLLIDAGVRADRWQVILVLLFLPVSGFLAGRVNFKTDD